MELKNGLPAPVTATTEKSTSQAGFTEWAARWKQSISKTIKKQTSHDRGETPHVPRQENHGVPSQVTVVKAEVLEALNMHKSFKMPSVADIEVKDLPNFYDTTSYDFKGSQSLTVDSKKAYEILTDLADQAYQAINIASYDTQSLLARHCQGFFSATELKKNRMTLEFICNKEDEDGSHDQNGTHANREDFFNFINYCTAVLARIICTAAKGKSLHVNVLTHLASMSTKLKVVSAKPQEFSQLCLDNGVPEREMPISNQHGFRERQGNHVNMADQNQNQGSSDSTPDPGEFMLKLLQAMASGKPVQLESYGGKDAVRKIYYAQCFKFQFGMFEVLNFIFHSLRGSSRLMTTSVTSYEMCAIAYKIGFEKFSTLVFQDRDNDFMGTSDASTINYAQSAFRTLDQTVRHIRGPASEYNDDIHDNNVSATEDADSGTSKTTVAGSDGRSVGTRISWSYCSDGRDGDNLRAQTTMMLKSMSHVISIIVPLLFTHPASVNIVTGFITLVIFAEFDEERQQNPIQLVEHNRYTTFFCLTTNEYQNVHDRGPDEAQPLSRALIRRKTLIADEHVMQYPLESPRTTASLAYDETQISEQRRLELTRAHAKMKLWVFEEKGVMVQCQLYVLTFMVLCGLVVAGGIAFGASVGPRIPGVDPFNITSYCWVLSAFILLIAKSVRVHDWPWNDFLHGRVLCRSVSELSSVTGIDDQFILAKLLQDESISFLHTRGPYNAVFRRKADHGFSIDRPLDMWAMLLSGLVMIEVESARGRGVVCLGLRRGTKPKMIKGLGKHTSKDDKVEYIHGNLAMDKKDRQFQGDGIGSD